MSTRRTVLSVAILNGYLYAIGGYGETGEYSFSLVMQFRFD
jgi:hypothetical protein